MGEQKKRIDITGSVFGRLKVLKVSEPIIKGKQLKWICKCECGIVKPITGCMLRSGHTRSCGCIRKEQLSNRVWKGCGDIGAAHLSRIKCNAKSHNRKCNLTLSQLWNLYLSQNRKCALTGLEIVFVRSKRSVGKTTASLDRIDSSKEYTIDNVQWVHKDVNYMKQDYSQDRFIEICKLVAEKQCSHSMDVNPKS